MNDKKKMFNIVLIFTIILFIALPLLSPIWWFGKIVIIFLDIIHFGIILMVINS